MIKLSRWLCFCTCAEFVYCFGRQFHWSPAVGSWPCPAPVSFPQRKVGGDIGEAERCERPKPSPFSKVGARLTGVQLCPETVGHLAALGVQDSALQADVGCFLPSPAWCWRGVLVSSEAKVLPQGGWSTRACCRPSASRAVAWRPRGRAGAPCSSLRGCAACGRVLRKRKTALLR